MGKTVGKIAAVAGIIALNFIPGVGQALSLALGTSLAVGSAIVVVATAALGLAITSSMKPKVPEATLGRLNLSFNPNASRKTAFGGPSAMPAETLYS